MADLYKTTPEEYLYLGTSWHAWANDAGGGIMADPLICLSTGWVFFSLSQRGDPQPQSWFNCLQNMHRKYSNTFCIIYPVLGLL